MPPPAFGGAAVDQDEQADDQQRRAEAEQDLGQQRLARARRFGVDPHALFLQQRRQLAAVPEARHLGGEQLRGRRLLVARRVAQLGLELALDRVALGGDRADRAALDLFQEVRAERHRHPLFAGGGLEEQHRQPVERDQRQHEVPEAAHSVRRRAGRSVLGHAAAVGRGRDLPAALVARQRRMRFRASVAHTIGRAWRLRPARRPCYPASLNLLAARARRAGSVPSRAPASPRRRPSIWPTIEREMTMFKNVLVGVDGSSNGRDAIALASRLIDPADGKLTLAHVYGGELHPLYAVAPDMLDRGARGLVAAARARARRGARRGRAGEHRRGDPGRRPAPPGRGTGRRPAGRRLLRPRRASAGRCSATTRVRRSTAPPARSRSPPVATPRTRRRSPRSASPTTARRRACTALASAREVAASTGAASRRWKSSRSRGTPTPV